MEVRSSSLLRKLLAEGEETLSLLWMEMTQSELLKLRLPGQHNLVQWCVIVTPGKLTTAPHFCDQEQVTHSPENILEKHNCLSNYCNHFVSRQRNRIKALQICEKDNEHLKYVLLTIYFPFSFLIFLSDFVPKIIYFLPFNIISYWNKFRKLELTHINQTETYNYEFGKSL